MMAFLDTPTLPRRRKLPKVQKELLTERSNIP